MNNTVAIGGLIFIVLVTIVFAIIAFLCIKGVKTVRKFHPSYESFS